MTKDKVLIHYVNNRAITRMVNKYGTKKTREMLSKVGCSFTEEELQKFIRD